MDSELHEWFGLSYAQYLTIPRSALQSMPIEWQNKMAKLLEELDEKIDWRPDQGTYRVRLWLTEEVYDKDEEGFIEQWSCEIEDPLMDYDRGRRKLPLIG